MRTILISNNLVRLSFLGALLRDAGIESILLDGHVSAVEGSIDGFVPVPVARTVPAMRPVVSSWLTRRPSAVVGRGW